MKCMVIDGNSIINRAYYGIRPLTNREGLYTHAVFGFLTTLLRLKEEERPDALCVTFDLHAPTFRHKADEAYKATRKPMPEELRMQVPVLKEVLDTLNIHRYEMEGWEADDLIGTISRKCEAAGWDCVVVTGDKDSLQLITDHTKVKLVSTRMGQTTTKDMTPETFREQYGFEPIHMIDLKALMGDTSDNIPGVPGVGEKTAMDLIQKYGSVDAIYEKLPDIDAKPAAIKRLTAGEDAARHSYWLATIVTDAPLSFDPAENRVQEPTPAAYPLFLKLEFSKLIEKMGLRPEETAPADAAPDVTVTAERITEESRAREVLELFRKADHVTVLALPDLSGVIADCDTGADTALSAEFFFERYTGDWNALLNALFAAVLGISFQGILGYIFYPVAWVMGVPAHEALQVGSIMATKLVSNEFVAMMDLQKIASTLSPRAEGILSVFLVSFANFSSIGIIAGAIKGLNEEQGNVVSRFGLKLVYGSTLVSVLSASIAALVL